MTKWTKTFPKKEGLYWFYGYRHGKVCCGHEVKKEFCLVKVVKISNGLLYISNGKDIIEEEVEEPLFLKTNYPKIPNEKEIKK